LTNANYTKVNATFETNHVLNILAAERQKTVYDTLEEIMRSYFSDYFRKIGY
jgi:hypothetical protein